MMTIAYLRIRRLDERADGSDIQEYLRQKTGQGTVPNVFISESHSDTSN